MVCVCTHSRFWLSLLLGYTTARVSDKRLVCHEKCVAYDVLGMPRSLSVVVHANPMSVYAKARLIPRLSLHFGIPHFTSGWIGVGEQRTPCARKFDGTWPDTSDGDRP